MSRTRRKHTVSVLEAIGPEGQLRLAAAGFYVDSAAGAAGQVKRLRSELLYEHHRAEKGSRRPARVPVFHNGELGVDTRLVNRLGTTLCAVLGRVRRSAADHLKEYRRRSAEALVEMEARAASVLLSHSPGQGGVGVAVILGLVVLVVVIALLAGKIGADVRDGVASVLDVALGR